MSDPLNVLVLQSIPPWQPGAGGGPRVHHEVAEALHRGGDDVRAAFLGPPTPSGRTSYRSAYVGSQGRLIPDARLLRDGWSRAWPDWRPDVVFSAAAEPFLAVRALPRSIAQVAVYHHYDPPALATPVWRAPRQSWRLRRHHIERRVLQAADRLIAPSEFGARCLRERGYARANQPITVVHNGVGAEWFEAPEDTQPPARHGFLAVGRLDHQKGFDVLLDALAQTRGSWPLTLVGSGWLQEDLKARARALGVEARVTWRGHADSEDVRTSMGSHGALVLPSRGENCPLVLLEAMAAGLPAAAARVGGIPELVTDGQSALLVPSEDPAALAQALDRLETDPALRSRLAEAARSEARARSWARVGAEVREVFVQALEARRGAGP